MAIPEATRLLAPGVAITLADGKSYLLKFDFEALCILEEELGGLDVFLKAVQADGWPPGRLRAFRAGMVAALNHTGLKRADVVRLMTFRDVVTYVEKLTEAFNQAMPEFTEEDLANSKNGQGSSASPGDSSSGLPSSDVAPAPVVSSE